MSFFDRLREAATRNGSLLCVGLDPRPDRFPDEVLASPDPILAFNRRIVDATRDLVCAYKPNYAFYEAQGLEGLRALRGTIDYIGPEIPVILDAKRGDIGATAEAYAQAAFEVWGAGAVTVAPYLGGDSVLPFTAYEDRGVFVLCHTSNPSASELQTLRCGGEPLYRHVARLAGRWSECGNVGLVVGATYPQALREIRELAPETWFLVPGIGAQGGDLEGAVAAGLRPDGLGMVINVSRGVCHAPDPRQAAIAYRDQINAARRLPSQAPEGILSRPGGTSRDGLILDLARIGAVRFGSFTLKSGATSPIYIDLRLLASHPDVLGRAAQAYADLLAGIEFDRIAAIPYAALPIGTAVALQTGRPMIYPRKEVKGYGTRRAIEGVYHPGERAVVLDDLISTGESKVEAIAPLVEAGLVVRDIVVLIDRESGGRETLSAQGYRLHAVLTLRQILDLLVQQGQIGEEQRAGVIEWLASE
ncbi:MAG: orotidine-5'-phosphate decarboxylase [Anaerolineae bacterium]|nr:orotidine-5'-phosphate decarboxylase [Anaerolineae bacterium]